MGSFSGSEHHYQTNLVRVWEKAQTNIPQFTKSASVSESKFLIRRNSRFKLKDTDDIKAVKAIISANYLVGCLFS